MANERELSEKLAEIASVLENLTGDNEAVCYDLAQQLKKLSNEKYAPGNSVAWKDVKPKSSKKSYSQSGRQMPF